MGFFTRKKEAAENIKKIIEPDIQIMMLGSRRVGKTSILASMTREFNKVTKGTKLVLTSDGNTTTINEASDNMKNYFKSPHKPLEEYKMDENATKSFVNYDVSIDISGRQRSVRPKKIRFKDCAGEWIKYAEKNQEEMGNTIEESSVIIIAIDSVLMMEKNGFYNKQNNMDNVTNFIKKYMRPGELVNGEKMVLFVPLKCEKYYYQDKDANSKYFGKRMKELNDCVKENYSELLAYLCNEGNRRYFTVAIMPILTLGGLEFDHFENIEGAAEELTSDNMVYTYRGKGEDVYNPLFCEQPLVYSLLYEQEKIYSDYYSKSYNSEGKLKMSAKLKNWYYEKKNWATDSDFDKELDELKKNYRKGNNSYVEVIQGAFVK